MSGKPLKLDFNERADSQPAWLKSFQLDLDDLGRYPDRSELEDCMAADLGLAAGSVLLTNGGLESPDLGLRCVQSKLCLGLCCVQFLFRFGFLG